MDFLQNSSAGSYGPVSLQEETSAPLQERFLGAPPEVSTAQATPMIQIIAPADLPEGYELPIQVGSTGSATITIPPGGVERGQTFAVPMPETTNVAPAIHIPVGHWRDTPWDFFQYGPCHPHCWTSWLCTFLATGQVIRRVGFNWTGVTAVDAREKAQAFPIILAIVALYMFLHFTLLFIVVALDPEDPDADSSDPNYVPPEPTMAFLVVLEMYKWWHFAYWILSTVILAHTRRSLRQKYGIPAACGQEDIVCAVCCHCCVAAQMLRHTTDYNVYPSYLCTDTGLPKHAPSIV
jgi:Cys-rich protein (TIGR01571 family)